MPSVPRIGKRGSPGQHRLVESHATSWKTPKRRIAMRTWSATTGRKVRNLRTGPRGWAKEPSAIASFTCLVDRLHRRAVEVRAVIRQQHIPRSAIDWSRATYGPLAIIAVLYVAGHDEYATPTSRRIAYIGIIGGNKAVW